MVRLAVAIALLLLTGCGDDASVPATCPQGNVLSAMNEYVDGSVFIDTQWDAMPNTDLAAALEAGGIACSYGIQEAEIGATVLWSSAEAFDSRRAQWKSDGQVQVDVMGADEAWVLQEVVNNNERHLWAINLLVDGVWIHIAATFLPDLDAAGSLVAAAIAELRG